MLKTVGAVGSHRLVTISVDAPLTVASERMVEKGIRHLPVVDAAGHVVGILSDRDLKRAQKPDTQAAETGSKPRFAKDSTVRDYMTWPAQGVDETSAIGDVVRVMLNDRISSLMILVGPKQAPMGIVTTDDLLRFLLKLLDEPGDKNRLVPMRDFFSRYNLASGYVI